jgi:hypothetical protein
MIEYWGSNAIEREFVERNLHLNVLALRLHRKYEPNYLIDINLEIIYKETLSFCV